MWLVVVDTMQIQPYIFGSNRLRENVGASYLVDVATRDWAFEAVRAVAPGNNNIGPGNNLISDVWIEKGRDAEVFYSGGGNFVVLFSDVDKVKKFNSHLSQRVLLEAPDLQLLIAQQKIDWSTDVLYVKLDEVLRMLAVQKRNHDQVGSSARVRGDSSLQINWPASYWNELAVLVTILATWRPMRYGLRWTLQLHSKAIQAWPIDDCKRQSS